MRGFHESGWLDMVEYGLYRWLDNHGAVHYQPEWLVMVDGDG